MRYLSENDVTQMMGSGYLGEVRQGPDGNLYQYVQGVDGLGNPIGGFWRRFKRLARRAVRKALPYVQQFAPLIPGAGPALSVLTSATPAASATAPVMMPMRRPKHQGPCRQKQWRRPRPPPPVGAWRIGIRRQPVSVGTGLG